MSTSCGCCKGVGSIEPQPTSNRPGLDALRYRVGTHGSFLDRMITALTLGGDLALEALTTRTPDDATMALLDAWATVADVLTFYQERIANEGYLRTATERRSILELGRLVGYELRQGVAASVYLAYKLEKGYDVDVPTGARAQSLPGPGELPQSFETSSPLKAREMWNDLEPRQSRPTVIVPPRSIVNTRVEDARAVDAIYLKGTSANLKANDRVLMMFNPADPHPRVVAAAEPDAVAQRTKVVLVPEKPIEILKKLTKERALPADLNAVIASLKQGPAKRQLSSAHFNRDPKSTFAPTADAGPSLLAIANPLLKDTFYRAWSNADIAPAPELTTVDVLRTKAPLFGHNAPPKPIFNSQGGVEGTEEWPLGEPTIIAFRIGAGQPTVVAAGVEELGSVPGPRAVAAGAGLEVSIRRGEDRAKAQLPLVTRDESPVRLDNMEISAGFVPNDPAGTFQITLTPTDENRFGIDAKQVVLVSSPERNSALVSGAARPVVAHVQIESGGTKDPAQDLEPKQSVQYEAGSRRVLIEYSANAFAVQIEFRSAMSKEERRRAETTIALDAIYDQIVPGSFVLIERTGANGDKRPPIVSRVIDTATLTKTAFGFTAKVTQLTLEKPWIETDWLDDFGHSLAAFRNTMVYGQNEPQTLAEEPIVADVEGQEIDLQGLYDGLESGRWLIVAGERSDIPGTTGVPGTELVMLSRVEQDVERVTVDGETQAVPGSKTRSTLFLADPLAYKYKRDTVTIYGNVVKATHGETRVEILGSGDGAKAFQQFTLKQPPLTYVASTNPSGIESTLDVRVNDVSWPLVDTLVTAEPSQRCYTMLTDDAGRVTVVFGDGDHGARLPSGLQNVTSVYRNGIGKVGNVKRDQVTLLMTRPLGVKDVINPIAASGGADAESRDEARGNVPLSLLALDRLVSIADYEAFTRAFAGIGKASAVRLSDGRREFVHLTIAGADDIPVDETSDLYRHLNLSLRDFGDPQLAVRVESRQLKFLILSATVDLLPGFHWFDVERRLRAALLDAFSFKRRQLGQDVVSSEVVRVMHSVEGVSFVDVDVLDAVPESTSAEDLKTIGERLQLRQRVVANLAQARPFSAAEMLIFTPDVPDTLILRGPER